MKKVFDQTVRDIKREVNKKVLKVPGIEQKVLDATSNEPWGPHGSLLADIALATRNYHEYQMIMSIIWKRLSDTGKNWRHVYKALIILEYMVGHGSERVIDDIKEHAYQISTLSDFQYIDSSGRDQGSNVRKKSQSLVALVNDKERIIEVRQKAAANRDKFRNTSSTGGMYRPGSHSSLGGYGDKYDDDHYEGRYGGRDEDRNGYGREREWGYRDDDRYSRDGDRYGREYDERNGREGYRDDDYRGRSRSVDDYRHGSRSRSSDRERERSIDDDGHYSSRVSGAKTDDQSQDGRLSRKFSEQNIGAPSSYEEVVSESRSPVHNERGGETPAASAPRASSPPSSNNPSQATSVHVASASPSKQEVEPSDEFDPRGSVSGDAFGSVSAAPAVQAAPVTSNNVEMDLLGSLSDSFSSNALAIVPTTSSTATFVADPLVNSSSATTFAATPSTSNVMNQPFEDPFGDSPFKALPSSEAVQPQPHTSTSTDSFTPTMNQSVDTASNFPLGDSFSAASYSLSGVSSVQTPTNSQFVSQELSTEHNNMDILADILPPTGPSQQSFSSPTGQHPQPSTNMYGNFHVQPGSIVPDNQTGFAGQHSGGGFPSQGGPTATITSHGAPQTPTGPTAQFNNGSFISQEGGFSAPYSGNFFSQQGGYMPLHAHNGPAAQLSGGNFHPQHGSVGSVASQAAHQAPSGRGSQHNSDVLGNVFSQTGPNTSMGSLQPLSSSTGALAIVAQPPKDSKFETKSAVWADTLSRGLVNLNISGAKINPLNDIGIDFDSINRKEKRMEKQPATPATSTINMGKAMGSGSGIGRAGASVLRAPPNAMVGSGMGVGMGPGPGMGMGRSPGGGMGMGGYGGTNQPMDMGTNMGMGMNMGLGMQRQTRLPPGSNMPSGYNPMMGAGGNPQQPYGGYR
ncbi:clathrin interactor EPSIN 2-like isoform X2 [Malus domestica]|uniref:clathrin interactor EPSIN 2-like isoform X2 n=1 Tax=Malus domestica TaxID=3750 RepID=UPI0010A9D53D|nr:clathrin interactor EPSIN 2-like isoform X2 [Malus domestica]